MGKPYSKDLPHSVIETIESVLTIASQHDGLGLGLDLLASFFSMPAAETAPRCGAPAHAPRALLRAQDAQHLARRRWLSGQVAGN
jgi:hypothetical protein